MPPTTPAVRRSLRETWIVLAVFAAVAVWVTAAAALGYPDPDQPPGPPPMILGVPAWAFWAVAAPWGFCTAFSVAFALWGIADERPAAGPADGSEDRP